MTRYFYRNKYRLSNKRYARDNRLINFKSPYRRICLAPRCRLIISWLRIRFQGFVCSPIKMVRELGLERREAVWSLSTIQFKIIKDFILVREE